MARDGTRWHEMTRDDTRWHEMTRALSCSARRRRSAPDAGPPSRDVGDARTAGPIWSEMLAPMHLPSRDDISVAHQAEPALDDYEGKNCSLVQCRCTCRDGMAHPSTRRGVSLLTTTTPPSFRSVIIWEPRQRTTLRRCNRSGPPPFGAPPPTHASLARIGVVLNVC